jgi:ParB-like chromosome segregation protein Spo0J
MILTTETELIPLDHLRPHPENPRRGDTSAIRASIEALGFYGVLIAQRSTGFVIVGNHRLRAAQELELDAVPVTYLDVDDETALRILLADNRTSDLGTYDDRLLADVLSSLAAAGALAGTGYDPDHLERLLAALAPPTPPEAFPDVDEENLRTVYRCPSCSYEWSGKPR